MKRYRLGCSSGLSSPNSLFEAPYYAIFSILLPHVYCIQHSVPNRPQSASFHYSERPSFTPTGYKAIKQFSDRSSVSVLWRTKRIRTT